MPRASNMTRNLPYTGGATLCGNDHLIQNKPPPSRVLPQVGMSYAGVFEGSYTPQPDIVMARRLADAFGKLRVHNVDMLNNPTFGHMFACSHPPGVPRKSTPEQDMSLKDAGWPLPPKQPEFYRQNLYVKPRFGPVPYITGDQIWGVNPNPITT